MDKNIWLPGIEDRTALITGGSSGIGEACARLLSDMGAKVAITYSRGEERAKKIQEQLGGPDNVSIHQMQLQDPKSIISTLDQVSEQWPNWAQSGMLIHSAAVGTATVAHHCPEKGPEQTAAFYGINTTATSTLLKTAIGIMDQAANPTRRDIVTLSSVGSLFQVFPSFNPDDGASKAAVAFYTKHLAAQKVLDPNYRVNVIAPGATDTPMLQESFLNSLSPAERDHFDKHHFPNGGVTPPEDIAKIIAFLCSDLANAIRGATIDASAGLSGRPGLLTEIGH
jgi:NAD(P)-dependent dehydrogenase (short-subunit alcohol dehydrogenase family)